MRVRPVLLGGRRAALLAMSCLVSLECGCTGMEKVERFVQTCHAGARMIR